MSPNRHDTAPATPDRRSGDDRDGSGPTRRDLLRWTAAASATAAFGCTRDAGASTETRDATSTATPGSETAAEAATEDAMSDVMPAVFLPHGGGPWPFVHEPMGGPQAWTAMDAYMRGLGMGLPRQPEAILVVSAHWEEAQPTVMSAPEPPMLYDYYNFPPEAYEVEWPAPGAPELAGEIVSLLQNAGFGAGSDPTRGFDHGTFVPLKLAYPGADVPTLQVSLRAGLDPAEHVAIGRALAPLRRQGVFIVGSGMSYHNLRALIGHLRGGPAPADDSARFDDWLAESMLLDADTRETRLVEWESAPAARACHPREEHLLPLHVVAGAAEDAAATLPYRDFVMGAHVSAVHFG